MDWIGLDISNSIFVACENSNLDLDSDSDSDRGVLERDRERVCKSHFFERRKKEK